MSLIHDNIITAYQVDFEEERLILKTKYCEGSAHELTDVIFSGYFAHTFIHAFKGSILLDIEERSMERFWESEGELLEANRSYAWPIWYQTKHTKEELTDFLQENDYRIFEISSAYGLSGWVLSRNMEFASVKA